MKKEGIIQYIGLDKLTYEEKSILKSLAEKTHQRLKEMLHNQTDLVVHLKEEHMFRNSFCLNLKGRGCMSLFLRLYDLLLLHFQFP